MSLTPIPSLPPITSERKRSRKVCVVSSRLPERNGAKWSGGGRSTPGGSWMIPKAKRFFAVLVISKVTLPGAIVPAVRRAGIEVAADRDALLGGRKRGIDDEHESRVAVEAAAAQCAGSASPPAVVLPGSI